MTGVEHVSVVASSEIERVSAAAPRRDFSHDPLTDAHASLRAVGQRAGFEVIDLLPAFASIWPDGRGLLLSKNDNHFNAAAHRQVAEILRAALAADGPR
jgi:hypothetical protein